MTGTELQLLAAAIKAKQPVPRPKTCTACRYWAPDTRAVKVAIPGDGDCAVAPVVVRRQGAMPACREGEVKDGAL